MSSPQMPTSDFNTDLTQLLPRLRVYALSLTRDSVHADDLVQQTVLRSLLGRASFRPGTNFPGWIFRIQRNEFISGLRRERPTVELNDAIAATLSYSPRQESGIIMREFKKAFRTLAGDQRCALLLTALEGHSHETIASASGVAIGTVKSRVSRARTQLRRMLDLEEATSPKPGVDAAQEPAYAASDARASASSSDDTLTTWRVPPGTGFAGKYSKVAVRRKAVKDRPGISSSSVTSR
ncbi:sigma-70 family RNA polymerase sigma factor [Reyranella soli]|nr:sigma-70 family RNA polymerase sigma factor [Reyranella soli]